MKKGVKFLILLKIKLLQNEKRTSFGVIFFSIVILDGELKIDRFGGK